MKLTLKFLMLFITLLMNVLFISCNDSETEEPILKSSLNSSTKSIEDNTTAELTEIQKSTILRLQQINDSIVPNKNNQFYAPSKKDNDWGEIVSADVTGLFHGFKYGLKKGKGIWGKLSTALICSITFSVSYSAIAGIRIIATPHDITGIKKIGSSNVYQLSDVYGTLALAWNEQSMQQEWERYSKSYPEAVTSETEESFKNAAMHNLVLKKLQSGVIVPINVLKNFYSQAQLNFLNSAHVNNYFSDIPNILNGSVKFSSYCTIDPCPYATKIVDTYLDGIKRIQYTDRTSYINKTRSLSIEYIKVIQPDQSLNVDVKSSVVSTMYVAPLSGEYWIK